MNRTLRDIVQYVNAQADLMEALEADIKKGKKITSATVLKLSKARVAEKAMAIIMAELDQNGTKLQ